jgi:hypothetical protein
MKPIPFIILVSGVIIILALILIFMRSPEDSWMKDKVGTYIPHGNPASTPEEVMEQQAALQCAREKLNNFTDEKSSQCLGICGDYAIDVVHVPRSVEDNLAENQCEAYANKQVSHFIELSKDGEIVRIE